MNYDNPQAFKDFLKTLNPVQKRIEVKKTLRHFFDEFSSDEDKPIDFKIFLDNVNAYWGDSIKIDGESLNFEIIYQEKDVYKLNKDTLKTELETERYKTDCNLSFNMVSYSDKNEYHYYVEIDSNSIRISESE